MRKLFQMIVVGLLASALLGFALAQTATADGQVQKVDASAGKITLRHGPMKAFEHGYADDHGLFREGPIVASGSQGWR